MSSHQPPRVYTCDICGRTPLTNDEVAGVQVQFERPPYRDDLKAAYMENAYFHVCRWCLGTRRVPNPDPQYDEAVAVGYHESKGIARRFLAWLLQPEDSLEEVGK